MRRIGLVLLAAFLALGLASHVQAETVGKAAMRDPGEILGGARHSQAKVERYARSMNSTKYIMKTIPIYYDLAPRRNIAPDVLIAQAMVETGYGRYGGDSRPWNMAGIKKGGIVGDEPRDFEGPRPPTRARSPSANPTTGSTMSGPRRRPAGTGSGTLANSAAASGRQTPPTTTRSETPSTVWAGPASGRRRRRRARCALRAPLSARRYAPCQHVPRRGLSARLPAGGFQSVVCICYASRHSKCLAECGPVGLCTVES